MDKALITMGMPAYNEDKYIAGAIEDLLAQTYKNFILIIYDDGSTDRTQQICEGYAQRDERIVYVRNNKNMGSAFSFNYLLGRINTPYFMLCSGHDKWHPSFVEKLLPAFKEEKVILSYPKAASIEVDGKIGKILGDSGCNTADIDKPIDRYLHILRFLKCSHLFYGIWLAEAIKNYKFDFKIYGIDSIMLEESALNGKFKQCNEVLFWMRANRNLETLNETIKRQLYMGFKKKQNIFLAVVSYVLQGIKVPINKRYSLGLITKLWLIINVIYYKFFDWYVFYYIKVAIKKIIGQNNYVKLKQIIKNERAF